MASKTFLGKTQQYSGVKNAVQKTQQPEEEKNISPEQITQAFQSFGFEPNERGMNDLGFWVTRPVSEGPKLMEELRKRRMEINKKEDETKKAQDAIHESKKTLPRLSDNEIDALFDEYGLQNPDPDWVRNHFPNDPKKIRSILEVQRKSADDLLKKQTKNMVNSTPEVPKMSQQPQPMASPVSMPMMPNMGQGGPDLMQNGMNPSPASPFFVGDHSIVRILSPQNPNSSTLWLVDQKKKVLRPFESEEALQNAFEDPEAAKNSIITLSPKEFGQGGVLNNFTLLKNEKGLKNDGTMDDIDFSPVQLQRRYGQQSNPIAEKKALSILDGLFVNLNTQ